MINKEKREHPGKLIGLIRKPHLKEKVSENIISEEKSRPRQDSNSQSSDPKSDALSTRPKEATQPVGSLDSTMKYEWHSFT